jgi:hypothetical protein
MTYYRLYLLDAGDHFTKVEEAIAETDTAALLKGLELAITQKVEIWQEDRLVGTVLPQL